MNGCGSRLYSRRCCCWRPCYGERHGGSSIRKYWIPASRCRARRMCSRNPRPHRRRRANRTRSLRAPTCAVREGKSPTSAEAILLSRTRSTDTRPATEGDQRSVGAVVLTGRHEKPCLISSVQSSVFAAGTRPRSRSLSRELSPFNEITSAWWTRRSSLARRRCRRRTPLPTGRRACCWPRSNSPARSGTRPAGRTDSQPRTRTGCIRLRRLRAKR